MHPFPSEPSYLRCFTAIQATNPGHLIKSMGSRFGSELLLIQQLSAPGLSECQTEHSDVTHPTLWTRWEGEPRMIQGLL